MQLVAICPFLWKDGYVNRGTPIAAGPDDAELAASWMQLGFLVDLDAAPPPTEPPTEGGPGNGGGEDPERRPLRAREREVANVATEGGAEGGGAVSPMSSADMPSHVGRRVPRP